MRYELRLVAYDMLDQVCVSAACYETSEGGWDPSALVWANSEIVRGEGTPEATDWIREALIVMLEAL